MPGSIIRRHKLAGFFRERLAVKQRMVVQFHRAKNWTSAALQRQCAPKIRGAGRYFYVMAGAKYHSKALISCRAELVVSSITITIAIARREAAEKFPVPSAGLHRLTSYYRGASTMQPDQLLVACPKCHAWPMAVHAGKRRWASDAPMVRFTCAKCGHQEEERLGGSYAKRESSRQHEIAGGGF